jgi:lipid II:glycine glycyltransferase (peptidoglycan interpeptide bridge formation enzyme)
MQVYFPQGGESFPIPPLTDLVGITQSVKPMGGLMPVETLQKDLTKTVDELFMGVSKSTRKQIKQAQSHPGLHSEMVKAPTDKEILLFRDFYNQCARKKNTHPCSQYHVKTLKLLRDQGALIMTKVEDIDQQSVCSRVYAVDGKRAMSLYSASQYLLTENPQIRRFDGKAHRMLVWEDMISFKEMGYLVYDSGGLTNDPNIRKFKLEFGGNVVTEYSGYLARSLKGRAALHFRRWKLGRKEGRNRS